MLELPFSKILKSMVLSNFLFILLTMIKLQNFEFLNHLFSFGIIYISFFILIPLFLISFISAIILNYIFKIENTAIILLVCVSFLCLEFLVFDFITSQKTINYNEFNADAVLKPLSTIIVFTMIIFLPPIFQIRSETK